MWSEYHRYLCHKRRQPSRYRYCASLCVAYACACSSCCVLCVSPDLFEATARGKSSEEKSVSMKLKRRFTQFSGNGGGIRSSMFDGGRMED